MGTDAVAYGGGVGGADMGLRGNAEYGYRHVE